LFSTVIVTVVVGTTAISEWKEQWVIRNKCAVFGISAPIPPVEFRNVSTGKTDRVKLEERTAHI
jgi:hypothetical protein